MKTITDDCQTEMEGDTGGLMEKKYRTKVKPDRKKVGQLAYDKHWSVVGLIKFVKL